MSGRALFAIVCVIIAAGFLLPFYPRDVDTPSAVAAAGTVMPVAGFHTFDCKKCPAGDAQAGSRVGCPCAQVLPTAAISVEDGIFSLTVLVIVHPLPSGLPSGPQPLPPKLPAI